jgi:ATP-dependent DNA helicase PIF1
MLLKRSPQQALNRNDFTDAIRLFYDRVSVAEYNLNKLCTLGTPIATINVIHSNSAASKANPDDAGGLHQVLFLATQARVMLTANIWQQVGLCNGAAGTVHQFLYKTNHKPPELPIAVIVNFDNYAGPSFIASQPNCVPIVPLLFEWESNGRRLSRQQLPLKLRYAITIHKSQGQTLDKAVIDIGKAEKAAGCTFVAISRLRSINHGLLQPMSFKRLEAISTGKRFAERLREESRLKQLAYTHP